MKSFVFTDPTGVVIERRVQARDCNHAIEKLTALMGITPHVSRVLSYQDWKQDRDIVLEQMGQAPWQKRLNRQTKNLW